MKNISILLVVLFSVFIREYSFGQAKCPTNLVGASDMFVATYHSGGLMNQDGKYFVWGQDLNQGTTFQEVVAGYDALPTGVTAVKVSGGSSGDGFNSIIILGSDNKIYNVSSQAEVIATSPLSLPSGVTAASVTSFYGGHHTIAIVSGGTGYVYTVYNNEARANNVTGTAGTSTWGTAVQNSSGTAITNFVQIRGVDFGDNTAMIGFTADNKIYVWGTNVVDPGVNLNTTLTRAKAVTLPAFTGNIVLVGANKNASNETSYYFLTSTRELWSVGENSYGQLGDFTSTDRLNWVRVKTDATTNANVIYFSTTEHDATKSSSVGNEGALMFITSNFALYGAGANGDGYMGIGSTGGANTGNSVINLPRLAINSAGQTFDGSTAARQAKFVEVGGHITFVITGTGSVCAAGHGTAGSILGTNSASSSTYTQCVTPTTAICLNVLTPVNAGTDVTGVCGGSKTVLHGTPTGGTWAAASTNPTGASLTDSTVTFVTSANGAYNFIYSKDGLSDTVKVTVTAKPNAGTDLTACTGGTATLSGTPTGGTWSAQTGNPAGATLSGSNVSFTSSASGAYNFIYTNGGCTDTVKVTVAPCVQGTIDCSKTQIITAPVVGQPGQKTLKVTINVTVAGCFSPITVSGSGFTLATGYTQLCATTTGIQDFYIPVNYDGSALGTLNFTIGSPTNAGSCSADLTKTPKEVIQKIWTLDNCSPVQVGPALK